MKEPFDLDVFLRQLKNEFSRSEGHYVFFLGAGCSISSGIPAAGRLTEEWMSRLSEEQGRAPSDCVATYDSSNPAASYGAVLEALFREDRLRQKEIARICADASPSFGYCALANLLAHRELRERFPSILTTNFDDLIAEAFYRHTTVRPLVIDHESLAGFVGTQGNVPVVLKLHGDHRLAPRNTKNEQKTLAPDLSKAVGELVRNKGIIFVGYSGNDQGVADALAQFEKVSLQRVYWINDSEPGECLRPFLDKHVATWIKHRDFDHLMLALQHHFNVGHPDRKRPHLYTKQYIYSLGEVAERALMPEGILNCKEWEQIKKSLVDHGYLSNELTLVTPGALDISDPEIANGIRAAELRIHDRDLKHQYLQRKDWRIARDRIALYKSALECGEDGRVNAAIASVRQILEEAVGDSPKVLDLLVDYAEFLAKHVRGGEQQAIRLCDQTLAIDASFERALKLRNELAPEITLSPTDGKLSPNWTPNVQDDVVLSMHPDAVEAWRRSELPNTSALNLREFIVTTPRSNWHMTEPRTSSHWNDVERRIREKINELGQIPCRRIHVFAKGPYALAALLGHRLKERFGQGGRALVFYQPNSASLWENWGPTHRISPYEYETRFFDYDRDGVPSEKTKHVVLAIDIGRKLSKEEMRRALAEQDAEQSLVWIDVRPTDGINQQALSDPGPVDQCVHEFDAIVFDTAKKYPKAQIHLFYSGPLAILMRAAAKFHLLETAATLYERIAVEGGYVFVPALALRGTPRLLMGVAEKSYGSVSGPMTKNSEDNADLGIVVALHEEFRELLLMCGNYTQHKNEKITAYRFNRGDYRLVAAFVGDMGRAQAGRVAERMIDQWRPKSIVVMGIAAGIHDDLRVGDVYVPSQANEYMQDAKAVPNRRSQTQFVLVPGAPSRRADYALMDAVRNLEFGAPSIYRDFVSTCKEDLEQLLQDRTKREELVAKNLIRSNVAVLADGHVATGEVVGAAKAFTKWIRGNDRNVKALEMESAGVFMSAQEQATVTRALAIRGISDYGDERKKTLDEIGRGALRKYAMRNAVRLLWALLDANALPR